MTSPIARFYDETRSWGRGPLDPVERAAALAICAESLRIHPSDPYAAHRDADALLDMCGLLRKDSKP